MGVDSGYGSGKPLTAAQSASRRAAAGRAASRKRTVAAAGKKYGQKKGMYYTNPGMLASQKKRMKADNSRLSGNLLEGFTGFNAKDGVDLGDIAGLAISIPTAGLGGALLRGGARVAKMAIPKATRVAKAANRIATQALEASESHILRSKMYKDLGSNKLKSLTERKAFENQYLKLSDEASEKAFISAGRKNVARNEAVIRRRLAALQRSKRNR